MAKVTITMKDGTRVECDPADVAAVQASYERASGPVYYSESRGVFVPMRDMNAVHIRNAIVKRYEEWQISLRDELTPHAWLTKFLKGPVDDPIAVNLVRELGRRTDWKM